MWTGTSHWNALLPLFVHRWSTGTSNSNGRGKLIVIVYYRRTSNNAFYLFHCSKYICIYGIYVSIYRSLNSRIVRRIYLLSFRTILSCVNSEWLALYILRIYTYFTVLTHKRFLPTCVILYAEKYMIVLWKNLFARMQTILLFECIDCRSFNICVFAAGAEWTCWYIYIFHVMFVHS